MIIVKRRFSGCWFAIEVDTQRWINSSYQEKRQALCNYCRESDIDQVISLFDANPNCGQEVSYR